MLVNMSLADKDTLVQYMWLRLVDHYYKGV